MNQQETAALLPAAPDTSAQQVLPPSFGASSSLSCSPGSRLGDAAHEGAGYVEAHSLSQALDAVRSLTEILVTPIRSTFIEPGDALVTSDTRLLEQLARLVGGARLPVVPLDPRARQLSFDDSLLRYEIAWVHLRCMRDAAGLLSEVTHDTAQRFEEMLDQRFSISGWKRSPFTGLIQTIEVARVTGNITDTVSDAAIRAAFAATNRDDAWRVLRVTVQHIATECDFPNWTSTELRAR